LPAPKAGRGFLDARADDRLRKSVPTVDACWLRCVCMRLSSVGWRSRSFCVETRLMLRRKLALAADDVEDDMDEAVKTRSISSLGRLPTPGGEAARSASRSSLETISMAAAGRSDYSCSNFQFPISKYGATLVGPGVESFGQTSSQDEWIPQMNTPGELVHNGEDSLISMDRECHLVVKFSPTGWD